MADKYEKYSKEELVRLLRERDRKPKFGLVWERDEIDHDKSVNGDFVALDLQEDLSCGEAPYRNFLIEGDNFDALRYLRMTHAGKVKCIYIDPPYNTGNKDFIYNDHFVDKDDLYKHSKWLEYMYRRLVIARDLLREDGVIFVSIGEEEFANLSLLMDQVFSGMKVGTFVWRRRTGALDPKGAFVSEDHEYVVCFGGPKFSFAGRGKDLSKYTNPDNDPRGPWMPDNLTAGKPGGDVFYAIKDPSTGHEYWPSKGRYWPYNPKTMAKKIKEGRILFPKEKDGRPMLKRFRDELKTQMKPLSTWIFSPAENLPDEDDIEIMQSGLTQEGTKLVLQMMGDKVFNYPKPLSLLTNLIKQSTSDEDLIVDFFAGSGTTGHAALSVNAEDEGNRRFILVSSTEATEGEPEKNVCKDVAKERLERAINGYSYKTKTGKKDVEGLGGDFAYLRARRIPVETIFKKIQHDQVWLALQLIHSETVTPYQKNSPFQIQETEKDEQDNLVIYLPKITDAVLDDVKKEIKKDKGAVIYSWQPGLLKDRLGKTSITYEAIPQFLVDRFGAGAKK